MEYPGYPLLEDPFNVDHEFLGRSAVLNETIQVLANEVISNLETETAHLQLGQSSGTIAEQIPLSSPKINAVFRPFIRDSRNEAPPVNEDTQTRLRFKETNIADDLNTTYHKCKLAFFQSNVDLVNQSETLKLLFALVDRYRTSLQLKLKEEIENLSISLTRLTGDFVEHERIYKKLQSTEKEMLLSRKIEPTLIPRELVNFVVRFSNSTNESVQWEAKFEALTKLKSSDANVSDLSVQDWLIILNKAHEILTDNDWNYISIHVLKSVKSARFCRLYWLHRLRPMLRRCVWSPEELNELEAAVEIFGPCGRWQNIADYINSGRTAFACYKAWHKHINPFHPSRAAWSPSEDESLDFIVDDELQHECKGISLIDWGVVAARLQTRSAIDCRRRYCDLHKLNDAAQPLPFSREEDLSLLKAIQRLGTGGGLHGWGSAGEHPNNFGTWSVIAAEVPGGHRSAEECERRYNELCEKFQPWSYAETRRLFHFNSHISQKSAHDLGPFVAMSILPHFPGRGISALLVRLRSCQKLASILRRLRRYSDQSTSLDSFFSSTDLGPVRMHLFGPQSIFSEWIEELKRIGVSNPEGYAFSRLLSWKPRKPYDPPEGRRYRHKSEMYHDFDQLLLDLEEGLLSPNLIETSMNPALPPTLGTIISRAPSAYSAPLRSLGVADVVQLINRYQVKPIVFAIISKEIQRRMHQNGLETPVVAQDVSIRKRRVKPHAYQESSEDPAGLLLAGQRLLSDHEYFHEVLEIVLEMEDSVRRAYNNYNLRMLELMAPEMASDMLYFAQHRSSEPCHRCGGSEKRNLTNIPRAKFLRILRIRQLLLKSRVRSVRKGSLKTPWTMPFIGSDYSNENSKLPLMAHLPSHVQTQAIEIPPDRMTRSLVPLLSKNLGVEGAASCRRCHGLSVSVDKADMSIEPMPPNSATLLALKTLLLKMPELQKAGGGLALRLLHCRYLLLLTTEIDGVVSRRPDAAAILSSAKHRQFILRCFSLFLWPSLIVNLRTRDITDYSVSLLRERMMKVFEADYPMSRQFANPISLKCEMPAAEESSDSPQQRKRNFRSGKAWTCKKFPDVWTQFSIKCNLNLEVVCELPTNVKDLVRAGFVPKGFSS